MIALDAMGGDFAPRTIVEGALRAAKQGVQITLFGDQEIIERELVSLDASWKTTGIVICHTTQEIAMDEEPASAVRKKIDSSLVRAVRSVKDGQCHAVVSAGSSGALMIAALFILGRQEGIERPAIAGLLPTAKGSVLALDIGANTECKPSYLYQFAHLGAACFTQQFGVARPRIGLLSNGHEDAKGSQLTKEVFTLLKQSDLNFIGNVEPYGVFAGDVDVVVTDGFSGNVLIKTVEAVRDLSVTTTKKLLTSYEGYANGGAYAHNVTERLEEQFKAQDKGGALLLGVQGRVIVCHGAAQAEEIEKALLLAKTT